MRTKVGRVNVRNLKKIQEKQLLFQRFVTSIVGLLAGDVANYSYARNTSLTQALNPLKYIAIGRYPIPHVYFVYLLQCYFTSAHLQCAYSEHFQ